MSSDEALRRVSCDYNYNGRPCEWAWLPHLTNVGSGGHRAHGLLTSGPFMVYWLLTINLGCSNEVCLSATENASFLSNQARFIVTRLKKIVYMCETWSTPKIKSNWIPSYKHNSSSNLRKWSKKWNKQNGCLSTSELLLREGSLPGEILMSYFPQCFTEFRITTANVSGASLSSKNSYHCL